MALINCLECGKEISDKATSCPHCGITLVPPKKEYESELMKAHKEQKVENKESNIQDSSNRTKGMYTIIAMIIFLVLIVKSCSTPSVENESTVSPTVEEVAAPVVTSQPWTYLDDVDKMSGKTSKFAYTTSTNTEQLGFPYNGGTTMDLNVRKHPRMGTDVYITVNKGQLNHEYDGNSIMVKFDTESPQRYSVNEPSDNSRDTFFILGSKKFISKLKKSSKVIVEVEFYTDGNHQFEFNTANLEWK